MGGGNDLPAPNKGPSGAPERVQGDAAGLRKPRTSVQQGGPEASAGPRIGLYGGSFDPVHLGHLHVARAAQRAFGLERVLFVPAARPPHKPGAVLAGGRDRVAMLELALADEPTFQVESLELGREGPSYTLDTVRALEAREVGVLHLILGTDNLDGLPRWYGAEELLRRVVPIVVPRSSPFTWPASLADLPDDLADRVRAGWVDVEPVPGASRDIRRGLARNDAEAFEHLALPVATYVRRRGLYGVSGDRP